MDPADVEELLEQEERKAKAKDEAKKKQQQRLPSGSPDSTPRNDSNGRNHDRSNRNRYSAEREQNDQHRSRRSRDRAEDEDVKDGSDKASANGSVRSRRRSRSPGSDRQGRHSSRDQDGYRERERLDRGGDFYRGGGGGRGPVSHSNDDRYRPGSGHGDHRRERSPRRHDDRDYRSGHRRHSPGPGPRRAKTPEPTDDERDRRTVFVQQLAARLRSKELKGFFEQVGTVVAAEIVKDRVSGRSKGVGYVEFKEEESVEKAISLTGQKLLGIPIIAQVTEAEKNRQARNAEGTATQSNGIPFHRLYVGNIHFSITDDDLKNVFEPFGELEFVSLQKEEGGRSKGYGFVQFRDSEQAKEALDKMNNFELAGRAIRVGLGNDKFTPETTQSLLSKFNAQAQQSSFQGSAFSGMGGRGAHAGGTGNFDRASGRDVDKTGGASALDDTDVAGVNFSNYSRDSLMRKLARTDEPEQKVTPKTQHKKQAAVEETAPTRCVLVKNVYSQAEQDDPDWQKILKEDFKEECELKYGKVVYIGLALDNDDGEIYIKFTNIDGGHKAIQGLNGRFFDQRVLTAQYVVDAVFDIMFPKAKNV